MTATAPGETNLQELIRSMRPSLDAGTYVFARLPSDSAQVADLLADVSGCGLKMLFREDEAWTAIVTASAAQRLGLQCDFTCRQITLNIHSSLDAVGFLAAITTRLATLNIGVNPVSAYYHDHLFVPDGSEDKVMQALQVMADEAGQDTS